jgi:shikimate kinase
MEEFQEVLAARIPYYAQAADVQVDTSALSLEDVVARVWSIVQERKRA